MTRARSSLLRFAALALATAPASASPFELLVSVDWSLPDDPPAPRSVETASSEWTSIQERWPRGAPSTRAGRELELALRVGDGTRRLVPAETVLRSELRDLRRRRCPDRAFVRAARSFAPGERAALGEALDRRSELEGQLRRRRAKLRWVEANLPRREELRRAFLRELADAYPEVEDLRRLADQEPCGWLGIGCEQPDPEAVKWEVVRAALSNPFQALRFLGPSMRLKALRPAVLEELRAQVRQLEQEVAALPPLERWLDAPPCRIR